MKMGWHLLVLLLFVGGVVAACSGEKAKETEQPQLTGPALVMFYTDN